MTHFSSHTTSFLKMDSRFLFNFYCLLQTLMGGGMYREMAWPGQSSMHAPQCQHSSVNLVRGYFFFCEPQNTSSGQISAQSPQRLHFFRLISGGIVWDAF